MRNTVFLGEMSKSSAFSGFKTHMTSLSVADAICMSACWRCQSASQYRTRLLPRSRWLNGELTYDDRPGVTVIPTMGFLITKDRGKD